MARGIVIGIIACLLVPVSGLFAGTGADEGEASEGDEGLLSGFPIPLEISADAAIYSDYIWRGFTLDDDPVIQPAVSLGAYGLSANFWSSFDIVADDDLDADEVDFTLDYTYEHDLFSVSVGHTWYTFPPANGDTQEFYAGGSVNIPVYEDLSLSPSVTWFHDYGDTSDGGADGDYFLFAVGHNFPLFETGVTLDLYNTISYNHELFIKGDGGEYLIGAGLTIPLYRNVTINPNVNYSVPFGNLADTDDGNADDKFFFGATLSFSL